MSGSIRQQSLTRQRLVALSAAIGGALAWWHWGGRWFAMLAITTAALLALALVAPRAYGPVFAVLDYLVRGMLQTFTWILLGLLFVLIFVPGRVVLALRRRDPLARKLDTTATTFWVDVSSSRRGAAQHFRAQF